MAAKGAVACGHPATAAAAKEILSDGGTAFDAALAGLCAAAVAEPVLCSLAGGGFLLAQAGDGEACLYDFFVQTPGERPGDRRPLSEIDFYPILADFGTATQEFHIGLGSVATPGIVKGLFDVHRDLGRLPMRRIVEPAVALAQDGVPLRPVDTYLFQVVGPILTARSDSRGVYTRPDGSLLREGDSTRQPELADSLLALAEEGDDLFYRGELADRLVRACRQEGGLLSADDLQSYRTIRRRPLERRYRGARIVTNPPPSTGGILIAFALALLAESDIGRLAFGSPDHLALMTRVMAFTNQARVEARLHDALGDRADRDAADRDAADRLLDPELVDAYAKGVGGRPKSLRGTTHISVVDAAGNIAALTLSNGEGCGYVLPGSGIMLNNMLGEEDLNAGGFHAWPRRSRLASMMAPTLAFLADGSVAALGSGGSNRIRTAILQVLTDLIDFGLPADTAVTAPRLHFEDGVANFETEFEDAAREALSRPSVAELVGRVIAWPHHNLFFGGVHAVTRDRTGVLAAAGDPRRGGAAVVV